MTATKDKAPAIITAMSAVMDDLTAIGKDRENKAQGWSFRGIDQVYNAIHPLLTKHKIFMVPRVMEGMKREERQSKHGGLLLYTIIKMEFDFVSGIDGSKITVGPVMGEAMDTGDKSCNKCMSIAHKYAIFMTFVIPTEQTDDPDADTYEVEPIKKPKPKKAAKPAKKEADPMVNIEDEAGAKDVVDTMIQFVDNFETLDGLKDFWNRNVKVIDKLDTDYSTQYQRLLAAFTATKTKIAWEKKDD